MSVPGVKKTDPMESDLLEEAACSRAAAATITNKINMILFIIPTFSAALIYQVSNTILTFLFRVSFSPCGEHLSLPSIILLLCTWTISLMNRSGPTRIGC
jgi:cytochrome c biogenesis factor